MIRRILSAGLWILLGLALVGTVVLLLRAELAEHYLEHRLAGLGYPDARLEVTRLGWEGARIRDISLGRDGLKAGRLDVAYTPTELLRGRVRSLDLTGAELVLDPSSPGGPLAGLPFPASPVRQEARERSRKKQGAPPPLPRLEIRDSRVRIRTARGEVAVDLAARFEPGRGQGRIEAGITGSDGARVANFALASVAGEDGTGARLEFRGRADLGAPVWQDLGLLPETQGRLETAGRLQGRPRRILPSSWDPAGVLRALAEARLKGTAGLELVDGRFAGGPHGLHGRLGVTVATEGPSLQLGLVEPLRVSAAALGDLGLGGGLPSSLTGPSTVTVAAPESTPLLSVTPREGGVAAQGQGQLRWTGSGPARVRADMRGELGLRPDWGVGSFSADPVVLTGQRLDLGGIPVGSLAFQGSASGSGEEASGQGTLQLQVVQMPSPAGPWRDVALTVPVEWQWRAGGQTQLRLRDAGGRFTARPPEGAAWGLEDPVRVALAEGQLERLPEGRMRLSLRGQAEPLVATLRPPGGTPLTAEIRPGAVRIEASGGRESPVSGELILGETSARVPAWGLELTGLTGEAQHGKDTALRLSLGRLRSTAEPPWIAPVTGELALSEAEGGLVASGRLGPIGRPELVELAGKWAPGKGDWDLSLDAPAVAFVPGELQPEALSPRLSGLRRVRGGISAEAELAPKREQGRVRLLELSLEAPPLAVEGLSGVIELDRLLPPTSPPGQELSAQRIVAGVPLSEPEVRFSLIPGSGPLPAVRVEEARGGLFGGRVRITDEELDPGAEATTVTLRISDLSLKGFLEELGIADLSGTGRLSGDIPLRLSGGGLAVETGRLKAEGDGLLRYRSEAAKEALGGAGQQVRLMLRALEDFHYEELAVTLHQSPDEGLELKLTTLGHNPEVLEGHPFRINLNLTGDLGPLIRALARGRELSADLLERALELRTP